MQVGSAAPAVAPEIFPTMALEVDRPEWGRLKGERLCSKYQLQGAVGGQFTALQLYLPTTSQEVAVVTEIKNANATVIHIARMVGIGGGVAGWTGRTTATRDFRWGGQATSCILESGNFAALPARFPDIGAIRFDGDTFREPIVITPGTSLCIYAPTVNQAALLSIHWYERPGQPGELV